MSYPMTLPEAPGRRQAGRRRSRGFSLIEIAVVVAISGILASVAYPSYQNQVRNSRRADAQSVLMQAAEFLERHYTENLRYDASATGTAVALPAALSEAPREGATKYYTVSLESVTPSTYLLRAVPKGAQASDSCGTLKLDNVGAKTAVLATCWQR